MAQKVKNVLGIQANFQNLNGFANESSVSFVNNGKLGTCIAEERLSRKKLDGRFPHNAIEEVLKRDNVTSSEIDAIAVPFLNPVQTNYKYLKAALITFLDTGVWLGSKIKKFAWYTLYNLLKGKRKEEYTLDGKKFELKYCDHHRAHAAGAYYCSPFEKALVLTLDGGGDGLDGSAYLGNGSSLELLFEIPHFQSPGTLYSAVTNDLGFKRHRHEGKITGLAAYGNDDLERLGLSKLLKFSHRKKRFISKEVAKLHKNLNAKSNIFTPLLEKFPREDLAAAAQKILEIEVLEFAKCALKEAQKRDKTISKICLAGGVFANVKLNQRIYNLPEVENIFVYPAMGDDGLSGGAALSYYYQQNPEANKKQSEINEIYKGGDFSNEGIEKQLKSNNLNYTFYEDVELEIAKLLNDGKVVGRFNGKMEYGPRALGNRSIIGAPFDPTINDWLNKKLNRTEFMPFAPSINQEHAESYFIGFEQNHIAADFMTVTYDVKEEVIDKIPAVVHIDKTARPQIVRKETNASYHKIIDEFNKLSGVPVVLNTSFNIHEQPIVYSPQDAINGFLEGKLDVLAIGNYIVLN
jgi:carbamoyltransferase